MAVCLIHYLKHSYSYILVFTSNLPKYCKTNLIERECGGVDWINLAQDSISEGLFEHDNKTSISIKCWEILQ
jgi:hypothetical protein